MRVVHWYCFVGILIPARSCRIVDLFRYVAVVHFVVGPGLVYTTPARWFLGPPCTPGRTRERGVFSSIAQPSSTQTAGVPPSRVPAARWQGCRPKQPCRRHCTPDGDLLQNGVPPFRNVNEENNNRHEIGLGRTARQVDQRLVRHASLEPIGDQVLHSLAIKLQQLAPRLFS